MKSFLQELGADVLIFLTTLTLTMGTCTKKVVTCGSDARVQEVRAP